jgi:hypothetical protein
MVIAVTPFPEGEATACPPKGLTPEHLAIVFPIFDKLVNDPSAHTPVHVQQERR